VSGRGFSGPIGVTSRPDLGLDMKKGELFLDAVSPASEMPSSAFGLRIYVVAEANGWGAVSADEGRSYVTEGSFRTRDYFLGSTLPGG